MFTQGPFPVYLTLLNNYVHYAVLTCVTRRAPGRLRTTETLVY